MPFRLAWTSRSPDRARHAHFAAPAEVATICEVGMPYEPDWQAREERLFALCAEVAAATGRPDSGSEGDVPDRRTVVCGFGPGGARHGGPGGESGGRPELPVNKWTPLPTKSAPLYWHAMPVFAPSRGQASCWAGRGQRRRRRFRDRRTTSAPSTQHRAPGLRISRAPPLRSCVTPASPIWAWPSPGARPWCRAARPSDRPRRHLGLEAPGDRLRPGRYDLSGVQPGEQEVARSKATNTPLVYGPGAGYDPVNDEIVLFPHFTPSTATSLRSTET